MAFDPTRLEQALHTAQEQASFPLMDTLDFLNYCGGPAAASLTVFTPDSKSFTFQNIDLDIISQSCPLLASCFEQSHRGLQHSLEASSVELVARFLRFLYLGGYVTYSNEGTEVPCSLLIHAQLCRLGDLFEVPALMVQAHCNIISNTERSCYLPEAPQDLCAAIRYIYENLSQQRELIDTLLHYCISCFIYHGLGRDEEFRQLAYDLRPFHSDLCRTSFKRGFEDDGAIDIIRLPARQVPNHERLAIEKAALGDFLFDIWSDTPEPTPNFGPVSPSSEPTFALVRRPRRPTGNPSVDDSDGLSSDSSLSDAEGFSLVHRPKHPYLPSPTSKGNFQYYDDVEHTEEEAEEWHGVEAPQNSKSGGMYLQPSLADSNATIRPLLERSATNFNHGDDSSGSDSDWSVVDKSEAQVTSMA